jgi:hypothetical protein
LCQLRFAGIGLPKPSPKLTDLLTKQEEVGALEKAILIGDEKLINVLLQAESLRFWENLSGMYTHTLMAVKDLLTDEWETGFLEYPHLGRRVRVRGLLQFCMLASQPFYTFAFTSPSRRAP